MDRDSACRSANSAGNAGREMPQEHRVPAPERHSAGRNEPVRGFSHILPQAKCFKSQVSECALVTVPFSITAGSNNTPERYVRGDDGNFPVHGSFGLRRSLPLSSSVQTPGVFCPRHLPVRDGLAREPPPPAGGEGRHCLWPLPASAAPVPRAPCAAPGRTGTRCPQHLPGRARRPRSGGGGRRGCPGLVLVPPARSSAAARACTALRSTNAHSQRLGG